MDLRLKSTQQRMQRMAREAEAERQPENCALCGWRGLCFKWRAKPSIDSAPDYRRKPRVCPNCWNATRGRGDFNLPQTGSGVLSIDSNNQIMRQKMEELLA